MKLTAFFIVINVWSYVLGMDGFCVYKIDNSPISIISINPLNKMSMVELYGQQLYVKNVCEPSHLTCYLKIKEIEKISSDYINQRSRFYDAIYNDNYEIDEINSIIKKNLRRLNSNLTLVSDGISYEDEVFNKHTFYNMNQLTPLMCIIVNNKLNPKKRLKIIELLLKQDINLSLTDSFQNNVLHLAAIFNRPEVMHFFSKKIYNAELDWDAKNIFGDTPLRIVDLNYERLKNKGLDINEKDKKELLDNEKLQKIITSKLYKKPVYPDNFLE